MAKKTKAKRRAYKRKQVADTAPPEVIGAMSALRDRIASGPTKIRRSEESRGAVIAAFAAVLSDVTSAAVQISQQITTAPEYRNTLDQE